MRRCIGALIILFLAAYPCHGYWIATYDVDTSPDIGADVSFHSVVPTQDGGFLFGGDFWDLSVNQTGSLLVRVDSGGRVLWAKTYGPEVGTIVGLSSVSDGGYVAVGCHNNGGGGTIIRIDENGGVLWAMEFLSSGASCFEDVTCSENRCMAVGYGYFNVGEESPRSGWIVVFDANGTVEAQLADTGAWDINRVKVHGRDFFLTGESTGNDVYVAKFSYNATPVWRKAFGFKSYDPVWHEYRDYAEDKGLDLAVAKDGLYVAGFSGGFVRKDLFSYGLVLARLTQDGDLEWGRFWTFIGDGNGSLETYPYAGGAGVVARDDGVTVAGTYTVPFSGAFGPDEVSYIAVLRFDSTGQLDYVYRYGAEADDGLFRMIKTRNGGMLLVGYTDSFEKGLGQDGWVLELPETGEAPEECGFVSPWSVPNSYYWTANTVYQSSVQGSVAELLASPPAVQKIHPSPRDVQITKHDRCSFGADTTGHSGAMEPPGEYQGPHFITGSDRQSAPVGLRDNGFAVDFEYTAPVDILVGVASCDFKHWYWLNPSTCSFNSNSPHIALRKKSLRCDLVPFPVNAGYVVWLVSADSILNLDWSHGAYSLEFYEFGSCRQ